MPKSPTRPKLPGESAAAPGPPLPVLAMTVDELAAAARRELLLITPDLEPALYDRTPFLAAVRALAVLAAAHQPVRVLCQDPLPAVRRGHGLIELARRLPSAIEIRLVAEDEPREPDRLLLVDRRALCLRPALAPERLLVAPADRAVGAREGRRFEALWERAVPSLELRRLLL